MNSSVICAKRQQITTNFLVLGTDLITKILNLEIE
ncbi:unnamed protein product, partial [Tenebrio molitor]